MTALAIGGAIRRSGLDDRFLLFVTVTMALAVMTVVGVAAVIMLLMGDNTEGAGGTLIAGPIGAGIVFGPMLIVGLAVSIPVFAIVRRLTGGEPARPVSAEYAGVATAAAASVFWVALLSILNGDGAELVVGAVGVAAIILAPFVARWPIRTRRLPSGPFFRNKRCPLTSSPPATSR